MDNLKIGVVGLPGKWSSEVLADAVEARTGFRQIIDMQEVSFNLHRRGLIYRGQDLCELDALIIKKITRHYSPATLDQLEMLRIAEGRGVRVFSGAERILRLIDRLSCTVSLVNAGIPMPETLITADETKACEAVRAFGEAELKPLYSTRARDMRLINSDDGRKSIARRIREFHAENPMMYIQKKRKLSGRDFGMVFLGEDYLGSYTRVSANDSWNTTILNGGKYAGFEASAELIELGYRVQALFGLDFTTVDAALTEDGPIVFEVSAFGGFRGAYDGIGVDAPGVYADYVIAKLKGAGDD